MKTPITRAIVRITAGGKSASKINYRRRMYAIMRRYTPEVAEGTTNECFAEITGLRTFFKMSYAELAQSIIADLKKEIGATFTLHIAKVSEFETALHIAKKPKHIATYNEINSLFKGASFVPQEDRTSIKHTLRAKRIRLSIPYLGKVA